MQTEGLEQLLNALKKIALNTSGDHSAQVIAGEAISEFEKKQAVQHGNNANAVKENGCNFPLCQDKHYQQDLAEQLHRELYADTQFEPVAWQFYQNGKWWNGDQHNSNHRKNTEAAGIPTRDLYAKVSTNSACHECNSTGMRDSGGVHPWGEAIMVPCDCQHADVHPERNSMDKSTDQSAAQLAWIVDWLAEVGLLQHLVCQPGARMPALPYWILRRPQMIAGDSVVGYGKTPEEAIAASSSISI